MKRNKAKGTIDRMARGARRATDEVAEASDRNKKPSSRAGTKVRSGAERVVDKVKQAGESIKGKGRRAQSRSRASTSTRSRSRSI